MRDVFVTLVHGTFARDAAWANDDKEPLRSALLKEGFEVSAFNWSGSNTFKARGEAAERLREFLGQQIAKNPNAHRWVIAHSHGGNVAIQSIWGEASTHGAASNPPGLIALSTPFFIARASRVAKVPLLALGYSLSLWVGLIIGDQLSRPQAEFGAEQRVDETFSAVNFSIWGLCLAAAPLLLLLIAFLKSPSLLTAEGAERFVARVSAPKVSQGSVTVVRAPGDEASAVLALGQFLDWIGRSASRLVDRWWIMFLMLGSVVLPTALAISGAEVSPWLFYAPLVALALLASLPILGFAGMVAVGWEGPLASLRVGLTVEPTPPGAVTVWHLPGPQRGLAHSSMYADQEAIKQIVNQIRADVESSPDAER